jgi:hypothetical protein
MHMDMLLPLILNNKFTRTDIEKLIAKTNLFIPFGIHEFGIKYSNKINQIINKNIDKNITIGTNIDDKKSAYL